MALFDVLANMLRDEPSPDRHKVDIQENVRMNSAFIYLTTAPNRRSVYEGYFDGLSLNRGRRR